jgi:glycolate oxidase FAD binding subunit
MAAPPVAVEDALQELLGREHVRGDDAARTAHAVDGVLPRWVVQPGTIEEVSRLLALASAEDLAVVPRGSGGGLDLGLPPRRLDLVLDCRRLSGVVEWVPEDMVATVRAGSPLGGLAAELARRRQQLALDPWAGAGRTLGGVLATNASGPLRFRYGTARDLLLGVRFVQADGAVTWGGAKVVKSVTGYDVPKLLVGALGTLGVVVEATLRLHPIPPATGSWLFRMASHEAAGALIRALLDSSLQPDRVALLNETALAALGLGPAASAVAVSVSSVAEAVEAQGAALRRMALAEGAQGSPLPDAFWTDAGKALEAPVLLKISSEIRRLPSSLAELEARAGRCGARVSAVGEAGSGVLRAAVTGGPAPEGWEPELLSPLREALAGERASLVVERAPLEIKRAVDVWGPVAPAVLAVMRRLKDEFDPRGILSPGRFVGGL